MESGGQVTVATYDAVFVCTGHHSMPNMPDWQDTGKFEGELTHSHNYRDTSRFLGKNVAVVEVGNSGKLSTLSYAGYGLTRGVGGRQGRILAPN